jgi:hypothetical protein
MDLYIHFPIRLHGVVLDYLSTGTALLTDIVTSVLKLAFSEYSEIIYLLSSEFTTSLSKFDQNSTVGTGHFNKAGKSDMNQHIRMILYNLFALILHNFSLLYTPKVVGV